MIRIIAVGRIKDPDLKRLCGEFAKRIGGMARTETVEVRDSDPDREGKDLLAGLGSARGNQFVVALDEKGEQRDSPGLAELLGRHGSVCFLVGGADGLCDEVRDRADLVLSLSRLTFTHELARLLLYEQIYRGLSILAGKPYHRS